MPNGKRGGLYAASQHPYTTEHTLAQVAKRVPGGIFCLLTALRFHDLTTQAPADVWVALPEKARKPRLDYPRLRVARFSGAALTEGIETHRVEGVEIRVYSAAKTVAFSVGGIGMMTIGMMARVSLGHTGRNVLDPPAGLFWMFAVLFIAAIVRVLFPLLDQSHYVVWIGLSQALWIAAFVMFLYRYALMLVRPAV